MFLWDASLDGKSNASGLPETQGLVGFCALGAGEALWTRDLGTGHWEWFEPARRDVEMGYREGLLYKGGGTLGWVEGEAGVGASWSRRRWPC